jgi:hypothetical protein
LGTRGTRPSEQGEWRLLLAGGANMPPLTGFETSFTGFYRDVAPTELGSEEGGHHALNVGDSRKALSAAIVPLKVTGVFG